MGFPATATIREGYERLKCEPCAGTGRIKKVPGKRYFYNWKQDRRRRPDCSECAGWGFTVHRKRVG